MKGLRFLQHLAIAGVLALGLSACGGSSSPTAPTPGGGGGGGGAVQTTTITITTSGVSPANIQISAGTRVTFVNNDSRPHQMSSDPHPSHTDCPALNMGELAAGQTAQSQPLTVVRTCGFHDHENPNDASLRGSVIVQ
jgi:plastocyanin